MGSGFPIVIGARKAVRRDLLGFGGSTTDPFRMTLKLLARRRLHLDVELDLERGEAATLSCSEGGICFWRMPIRWPIFG